MVVAIDDEQLEIAKQLCNETILSQPLPDNDTLYCHRTWDGWSCWNDTPAGEVAYNPCPHYIPVFDSTRWSHKVCMEDGTWFQHPDTNKTWSNYTTCVDTTRLDIQLRITTLYTAGYSISIVALVISMFIFCYFKSLNCTRITIHKNLFLSFIFNNFSWIIWYSIILDDNSISALGIGCYILHVITYYNLLCNYFWMFCEGIYLHTVLVRAFINEEGIMRWLFAFGWGIPAIFSLIYGILRGITSVEDDSCWMEESNYLYILIVPGFISMLLNFIFVIHIVIVLIKKMNAVNTQDENVLRKAVRATIILIPLLGLHYLVMPFKPAEGSPGEEIYLTVSAIVTSLQGLCVACLFCFFNGEVLSALARKWNQLNSFRNRSYSVAATSVSAHVC